MPLPTIEDRIAAHPEYVRFFRSVRRDAAELRDSAISVMMEKPRGELEQMRGGDRRRVVERIIDRIINPSCTLGEAADATGRDKSTISRWAKANPSLVAFRDAQGRAKRVFIGALHRMSRGKDRRDSEATAEARMERQSKRRARCKKA